MALVMIVKSQTQFLIYTNRDVLTDKLIASFANSGVTTKTSRSTDCEAAVYEPWVDELQGVGDVRPNSLRHILNTDRKKRHR